MQYVYLLCFMFYNLIRGEKVMNVYDFDGTIYKGDSTIDFYFYCLKKHPLIIGCLPKQVLAALCYKTKRISKTMFKEQFYCFVSKLENIDKDIIDFWNLKEKNIKNWYKNMHMDDDVIISASPEFLLREICTRLEINNLIASKVDSKNGKYNGENCYGDEKIKRFYEQFPNGEIDKFYSDSYSDEPMAKISKNSYMVKGEKIMLW